MILSWNKRFSKPKYTEFPVASPLGPPPGLCPGSTGGITVLCRPPAGFFLSLVQEKAFGLLQTPFGTQKRWYDKVLGKASEWCLYISVNLCKKIFIPET